MNRFFVPIGIAIKLKEIGFDGETFAGYQLNNKNEMVLYYKPSHSKAINPIPNTYGKYCHQNKHVVKSPLYQQVFEWFREKGFNSHILTDNYKGQIEYNFYCGIGPSDSISGLSGFETYEDAQNECILNLIKQYENNK